MSTREIEFLFESNKIEKVYDADSLMQAIYAWEELSLLRYINVGAILKAHKVLMLHQNSLRPNEKGYFRTCDVTIGGEVKKFRHESIFIEKLEKLCDKMNETRLFVLTQPMTFPQDCHIEFEDIHPFVDGNGRVGRMLYNWQRLHLGLEIDVIHEGDEQMEYYEWFRKREPIRYGI